MKSGNHVLWIVVVLAIIMIVAFTQRDRFIQPTCGGEPMPETDPPVVSETVFKGWECRHGKWSPEYEMIEMF